VCDIMFVIQNNNMFVTLAKIKMEKEEKCNQPLMQQ
jgi:hypothetical protein